MLALQSSAERDPGDQPVVEVAERQSVRQAPEEPWWPAGRGGTVVTRDEDGRYDGRQDLKQEDFTTQAVAARHRG